MFARLFAVASLAALVVAGPLAARGGQCNTGDQYCCNSHQTSISTINQSLAFVPVAVVPGVLASLGCSSVDVVNVGGSECNQQPICCENNESEGLVVVSCSPINL